MATTDLKSALGAQSHGPRAIAIAIALWTVACLVIASWWLHDRLQDHREQSLATANVRLNGVKDTLSISLRQLAALPLDLSHRPEVLAFMAAATPDTAAAPDIQQTLDRLSADFGLPLIALTRRDGEVIASTVVLSSLSVARNFSDRAFFTDAMTHGAAIQFLMGRVSRTPGLFFANQIVHDGRAVGVAVVKQDTDTLNRLINDADGAAVFVTDNNGVVVLSNRSELLLHRLPGGETRPDAQWQSVYQRVPEPLVWEQTRQADATRGMVITRWSGMRHATLSSPLGETPFKVWVLEPLDEEAPITRNTWTAGLIAWVAGCVLIWTSWKRLQLLDAALQARRDIFDLAQTLPVTVFRYTQPRKAPGRFSFIGRGVQTLFGLDESALERDPQALWRMAGTVDQPPTRPHEYRVENGDTARWIQADSSAKIDVDGTTTYNGYWLDITERRETQARFAAVFEYAATSYLFFDAEHGITHCNPATLRLFGTSDPQALLGRIVWFPGLSAELQADGEPSRERAVRDLREHMKAGQRLHNFEWRFQRVDGTMFDAEVNVIATNWAATPEFCAVIQDITARKQLQADTQRAREAAEAASQTKSSFLANMSHELRTPMNAIIGMTHLALDDGLPEKQRDYIEKAHSSACNLLQILNDILDVSKIEAGQMALERIDFELEAVIGDMADLLGLKADEKGLELLFSAAADLPPRLIGDPTRLRQVLVNLGSNAIKFTERGEVTVGMELAYQDANSVELHGWVRDTGVGLSEEEIGRLFQPFVQADSSTTRRYGGTGLGLVISRQLVERMGGRLWVESTLGRGSTFHFTARLGRSAPRAPSRAWMANELRGRRALLVDDNNAALDVQGSMLEALGVLVDKATSAEQALTLVDNAPDAYTWLLIDWKMPMMDGIACAREIVARHPLRQHCIILVTGFARDDALRASAGVPLAGVLHKPVTPSTLHDSLVQAKREVRGMVVPRRRTAGAAALPPELQQRLAGARVLLVEDHPLNQQLACELLRRVGVEVVVANDGREALAKLESAGPFDAVLMDCQMPVMDGYDATRALRLRPEWQQLPVIAMTASALAEDRDRALASGMNAHVTKPIHVDVMLRTLAEWMGEPVAAAAPQAPAADTADTAPAIDVAEGRRHCMDNDALYRRLLQGFCDAEASFIGDVEAALNEGRHDDALRRAHDLKGLAGTVGAQALFEAVVALHAALAAHKAEVGGPELARVAETLARVLAEGTALLAAT